MVEVEILFNFLTLAIVTVVAVFVGIAYYRTRIRRLLVLLLLAVLLGTNMLIEIFEVVLEDGIPHIGLLSSLLSFGIATLLLVTIFRRISWDPR